MVGEIKRFASATGQVAGDHAAGRINNINSGKRTCADSASIASRRSTHPCRSAGMTERALASADNRPGRIKRIGHPISGPGAVNRRDGIGWECLHACIDDARWIAYPARSCRSSTTALCRRHTDLVRAPPGGQLIMTNNSMLIYRMAPCIGHFRT